MQPPYFTDEEAQAHAGAGTRPRLLDQLAAVLGRGPLTFQQSWGPIHTLERKGPCSPGLWGCCRDLATCHVTTALPQRAGPPSSPSSGMRGLQSLCRQLPRAQGCTEQCGQLRLGTPGGTPAASLRKRDRRSDSAQAVPPVISAAQLPLPSGCPDLRSYSQHLGQVVD